MTHPPDEVKPDHDRIYLQGSIGGFERTWSKFRIDSDGPDTEYVRADLFAALLAERDAMGRVWALAFCVDHHNKVGSGQHFDEALRDLRAALSHSAEAGKVHAAQVAVLDAADELKTVTDAPWDQLDYDAAKIKFDRAIDALRAARKGAGHAD